MLLEKERTQIVEYGNRLIGEGLTSGTAGNLSIYDPDTHLMAMSPSGIPYVETSPEDVVVMDLLGNVVEGERKPSSEHMLHAVFYQIRPDIRAVVHAHSMYCTVLSCMGESLKSVHYALADAGVATIPTAPYFTFGTPELANAVRSNLGEVSKGILLANHGMVACGETMKSAFGLAKTMEWCAQVQWRCLAAGRMNVLSDEQMAVTLEAYKSYGQPTTDGSGPRGYHG